MAAAPAPRAHLPIDERPAQHGVVRYRSLPLGERVTLALVLARSSLWPASSCLR